MDAYQVLSRAIYSDPDVVVVEADSQPGQDLRALESEATFAEYLQEQSGKAGGDAHVAICYPDMRGPLRHRRVTLSPERCNGHTFRYAADGWGLIRIYLKLGLASPVQSFVSANSEVRAQKWASTYPESESPAEWDWAAVARHHRRLKGVLKKMVA